MLQIHIELAFGDYSRARIARSPATGDHAIAGPRGELSSVLSLAGERECIAFLTGEPDRYQRIPLAMLKAARMSDVARAGHKDGWWTQVFVWSPRTASPSSQDIAAWVNPARVTPRDRGPFVRPRPASPPEHTRTARTLLTVLGLDVFRQEHRHGMAPTDSEELRFELKGHGWTAYGSWTGGGNFRLHAGSTLNVTTAPSLDGRVIGYRKELLGEGTLVREQEALRLIRDVDFSSPSNAAKVASGRPVNGMVAWRTSDGLHAGQTIPQTHHRARSPRGVVGMLPRD
jgi:hypothetical protein